MEQERLLDEITEEQRKFVETITNTALQDFPSFLKLFERHIEFCDVVCFIRQDTYRLYRLYKLVETNSQEKSRDVSKIEFIMASELEVENVFGKRIILFDLIWNSDHKIFETYCKLSKLGAKQIFILIYGCSWSILRDEVMHEIYYDVYNILESEYTKNYVEVFCKDFYVISREKIYLNRYIEKFLAIDRVCKINLQIIEAFHEKEYCQFKNGNLRKLCAEIQGRIISSKHYKISIHELKATLTCNEKEFYEAMRIMKHLGILEFSNDFLKPCQNINYLLCSEGRICYFCVEALVEVANLKLEYSKYLRYLKKFMKNLGTRCAKICKKYREEFDKEIFNYHLDYYAEIKDKREFYCVLEQKKFLLSDMSPVEKKIYDEMLLRAKHKVYLWSFI